MMIKDIKNIDKETQCYMSHTDYIEKAPENFIITANSKDCPIAAMENKQAKIYAVQFHPEKSGDIGLQILKNFGEL